MLFQVGKRVSRLLLSYWWKQSVLQDPSYRKSSEVRSGGRISTSRSQSREISNSHYNLGLTPSCSRQAWRYPDYFYLGG